MCSQVDQPDEPALQAGTEAAEEEEIPADRLSKEVVSSVQEEYKRLQAELAQLAAAKQPSKKDKAGEDTAARELERAQAELKAAQESVSQRQQELRALEAIAKQKEAAADAEVAAEAAAAQVRATLGHVSPYQYSLLIQS